METATDKITEWAFEGNPGFQEDCFLDEDTIYKAALSGTGGGKTYLGAGWISSWHVTYPGTDSLAVNVTQNLLDEVTIPAIGERLTKWGIEWIVNRKHWHIETPQFASKFLLKTSNTARNMTGFQVGRSWIDEPARMRRGKTWPVDDVWENVCNRTRDPAVPSHHQFVLCTGTHEGIGTWFYDLFERNERLPAEKRNRSFKVYRGPSTQNPAMIDTVKRREKEMGPELAAQYVHGYALESDAAAIPLRTLEKSQNAMCINDWDPLSLRQLSPLFIGIDIGRSKSLSVIWVFHLSGGVLKTVGVKVLQRTDFAEQDKWFTQALSLPGVVKGAIDAGYNPQTTETLLRRFGEARVLALYFGREEKSRCVERVRKLMEQGKLLIPTDEEIFNDFYAVKRICSPSGIVDYTAPMTEDGHSDRFFACLAAAAAYGDNYGPVRAERGDPTRMSQFRKANF